MRVNFTRCFYSLKNYFKMKQNSLILINLINL